MPDRVTNIEIEDVLSSIRRLVSSDEREPRADAEVAYQTEPDENKLVLTPAQRIDPEDESLDKLNPKTVEGNDDVSDSGDADERAQTFRSGRRLEARAAEVEAVVAKQEDEWEPDGATEDAYADNLISPFPWAHGSATSTDYVEIAEDEENASDSSGTFRLGEAQSKIKASADTDEFNWVIEGTEIDEAALRDLVSEIVRQELQGALGERITRNVRKLVRREIQRALLAHRLD
jgi:cell pole-organizing protein PopZ